MNSRSSIQMRIAGSAGLCLAVVALLLISTTIISSLRNQKQINKTVGDSVEKLTIASLGNLAGEQAGVVQSRFDTALDAARTMADTFILTKKAGSLRFSRDHINSILLNVLEANRDFNGTYSCWEPDALDGNDSRYIGSGNGNNETTGRFTPYWTRSNNRIAVQPLVEYDTDAKHPNGVLKGGWYINPKADNKESVLDPIPYIVQGNKVWLATFSVPISSNGHFYGVAGCDYNLDFVQQLAKNVSTGLFEGKGTVVIVSYMGLVVADSRKPETIGQQYFDGGEFSQELLKAVEKGEKLTKINKDTNEIVAIAPIQLGQTGKPWAVLVRVPAQIAFAQVITLNHDIAAGNAAALFLQIIIGIIVVAAGIFLLWFLAGSVAKPVQAVSKTLSVIAEGEADLTKRINIKRNDEIGLLSDSYDNFVGKLAVIVDTVKKASTGLEVSIKDLSASAVNSSASLNQISSNLKSMKLQIENQGSCVTNSEEAVQGILSLIGSMENTIESQNLAIANSSSAIEEMMGNINSVSSTMEHLHGNFSKLKDVTQVGKSKLQSFAEKVMMISEQSANLMETNNTIASISSQTNLLAMNAAIEAAHAGVSGSGFSVVADEIRKLAEQSAKQSHETSTKLKDIKHIIEELVQASAEAESSFSSILDGITDVDTLETEVNQAMAEQNTGSRHILSAIDGLKSVSTQVTEKSEEMSKKAGRVQETMKELLNISEEIQNSAGEISTGAENINQEINIVAEKSRESITHIDSLVKETIRFKV
ncbi:MAG: methyl-accepting chemotaxis protein [Treponema sp.]|nr:methyl-accepting chemotaxis protein [Treponema sp.]